MKLGINIVKNDRKMFTFLVIVIVSITLFNVLLIFKGLSVENLNTKYKEYMGEDGLIYYPVFKLHENVSVIKVSRILYSPLLSGKSAPDIIFEVDKAKFDNITKLTNTVMIVYNSNNVQYNGLYVYYGNFFYKVKLDVPKELLHYQTDITVKNGTVYYVYNVPKNIITKVILSGVFGILLAIFTFADLVPKKILKRGYDSGDYLLILTIAMILIQISAVIYYIVCN